LAYLVRRLEGLPVLLLGSLRPSERGGDPALLAEIAGDPVTVSIRPRPLSERAAMRMVRERLGEHADEAFSIACHATTGGNPLLLHELLKALGAEGVRPAAAHADLPAQVGPRAASRAVLVRLARLPREAVKMARAAAVLGDGSELSTVAALAGIELREAGSAAAALVGAEILRAEPPLAFVHPLVRAALYEDLPGPERGLWHERAARLLAGSGAAAERVAAHLLASPARGAAWVSDTLLGAARTSLRRGAAEGAVTYLSRALREPPPAERRAEVLLELSAAEALIGGPAAVEHLSECYEPLDDPRARGMTAQLLGRACCSPGSPPRGRRWRAGRRPSSHPSSTTFAARSRRSSWWRFRSPAAATPRPASGSSATARCRWGRALAPGCSPQWRPGSGRMPAARARRAPSCRLRRWPAES
jgi:hypothetical protein